MSEVSNEGMQSTNEGNEELPPTPNPVVLRSLKIKSGVVKRLVKDKAGYEKEAQEQRDKLEEYKGEGNDESIIRNANNCLKETEQIIPGIIRRLMEASQELKDLLDSERETPVGKTQEFLEAVKILDEAKVNL